MLSRLCRSADVSRIRLYLWSAQFKVRGSAFHSLVVCLKMSSSCAAREAVAYSEIMTGGRLLTAL